MKVVIPTDDRKEIAIRTGRAKYFQLFEIKDGSPVLIKEVRNNHDHHDHEHDHSQGGGHHHGKDVSKMQEADVMICNHMGKHFKDSLDEYSIGIFVTKIPDIKFAIQEFVNQ